MNYLLKKTDSSAQKGFTLIELIVTIAILAVILTIVVVAINPAEQISRSRDAKRVGDLDSLKTAIVLYLAQATTTIDMAGSGAGTGCVGDATSTYFISRTTATSSGDTALGAVATSSVQTIGTTGWAPVRMDQTPGGSAIPVLPVDPAGTGATTDFWYAYVCDQTNKTFELSARLDSSYFRTDLDVDGTDGGNSATTYEVGNDPALDLIKNLY